jgi:uncharacterized protein (UPF0332 family)
MIYMLGELYKFWQYSRKDMNKLVRKAYKWRKNMMTEKTLWISRRQSLQFYRF